VLRAALLGIHDTRQCREEGEVGSDQLDPCRSANQSRTARIAPSHDAKTVMIDFVNQSRPAGGRSEGEGRHGSMKAAERRVRSREPQRIGGSRWRNHNPCSVGADRTSY
jgi:hypothetical protein